MKFLSILTGSLILFSTTCHADSTESNPHNFTFKPTFSRTQEKASLEGELVGSIKGDPYNQYGLEAQYFYLKPKNVFFESTLSWDTTKNLDDYFYDSTYRYSEAVAQAKIGYTFQTGTFLLSPYALGSFILDSEIEKFVEGGHHTTREYEGTAGLGMRINTALNRDWQIGMDANSYMFPRKYNSLHRWGYKISLPVTYQKDAWSYAISPFFKQNRASFADGDYLTVKLVQNSFGGSLGIRYSF